MKHCEINFAAAALAEYVVNCLDENEIHLLLHFLSVLQTSIRTYFFAR
ncbi:MAG: hypothetical protein GX891_02010 [Clostridiales bacterium]|nr:hypothetical protein [Clostridiales bacterium]